MDKSIAEHLKDFKDTINRGVEPLENITLPTPIIKKSLAMYLGQSVIISLWWAFSEGSISPIFIGVSSFLQVGWFWNKVTDSWKKEELESSVENSFYEPIQAPIINIHNDPIVDKKSDIKTVNLKNTNTHPLFPSSDEE